MKKNSSLSRLRSPGAAWHASLALVCGAAHAGAAEPAGVPTPVAQAASAAVSAQPVTAASPPTPSITITGSRWSAEMVRRRALQSDSARLLEDEPGVTLYEAGGVSALPVIRGLADDRVRVQVDGMDLMASCPNHMNSPLSYLDASQVSRVKVVAGITPVSAGGDSIAGSIQVSSRAPRFINDPETEPRVSGEVGAQYRSNGQARGAHLQADWASPSLALSGSVAQSQANNYRAGGDFKAAGLAALGRGWLAGDEVGSTAYKSRNQSLSLAWRDEQQQLRLDLGQQHIPYELYPNQRMDMTGNDSTQRQLRYQRDARWGQWQAQAYQQHVQHQMDMGPDRYDYGTGMPMDTESLTRGGSLQADVHLSESEAGLEHLRLGAELQLYWLKDGWPPVGTGVMAPNTFWNIDYGTRDRRGAYLEWDKPWTSAWRSLIGLRHDRVKANAGPVQGYNAQSIWADDAAAFNASSRRRQTQHWDWTALATYEPSAQWLWEGGLARKTRSPSLYERYPWSTQPMAALMNNFVGDGNGYIGNPNLRPEVAHTASLSADVHDAAQQAWRVKLSAYLTRVKDFIDAERCDSAMCGGADNVQARTGFVNLRYANQRAQLRGLELSAERLLGQHADWGRFDLAVQASVAQGQNTATGDALYHQMPRQMKLRLSNAQGPWTHTLEAQAVAAKTEVSAVRNEVRTPGYGLLAVRSSWAGQAGGAERWQVDAAIENLLNRAYALPLGGAYAGQGASMASTSLPWGVTVPGRGRSLDVAVRYRF